MAKGHPHNAGYRPGDNWDTCERCGFERRSSDLKAEWTGLMVCSDTCWEPRHEQEFLRAAVEADQATGAQDGTSNQADASASSSMSSNRSAGTGAGSPSDYTVPSGNFNNGL